MEWLAHPLLEGGGGCVTFTLNSSPELVLSVIAPNGVTATIIYGPLHLDLNFHGKSFSLEFYSRTSSPTLNSFLRIF